MDKLEVGQQLWFVPSRSYSRPEHVTVEAVGRKWAKLSSGHRCEIGSLIMDSVGYASPGRLYLSQEEHATDVATQKAWRELSEAVRNKWSAPVSLEAIQQAASVLGIHLTNGSEVTR